MVVISHNFKRDWFMFNPNPGIQVTAIGAAPMSQKLHTHQTNPIKTLANLLSLIVRSFLETMFKGYRKIVSIQKNEFSILNSSILNHVQPGFFAYLMVTFMVFHQWLGWPLTNPSPRKVTAGTPGSGFPNAFGRDSGPGPGQNMSEPQPVSGTWVEEIACDFWFVIDL